MLRVACFLALAQIPGVANGQTQSVCPTIIASARTFADQFPYCFTNCSSLCEPLGAIVIEYMMTFDVNATTRVVCRDAQDWLCTINEGLEACSGLLELAETSLSLTIPRSQSGLEAECAALTTTSTTTTPADAGSASSASIVVSAAWAGALLAITV